MKPLFWLAVGLAAIVVGWLLIAPDPAPDAWRIDANPPRIVGDAADPFAYAGGDALRTVSGSATIRLAKGGSDGTVRLSAEVAEADPSLSLRDGAIVGRSWALVFPIDEAATVWIDTSIHGDTGIGDRRLPETTARLAGAGPFELTIDQDRRVIGQRGFWSVADAVRQEDGSIRQQGLLFSPLLRDKTRFSDPSHLELTVLLYEDGSNSDVLVHLLFVDPVVERTPAAPTDD